MPIAEKIKQILSVAPLAVLLLSLGAADTSLGLIQTNTFNGGECYFFITYTQAMNSSLYRIYNVPTCKLSIASATIAKICLALLTAIELISVLFEIYVKTLIGKIIQVGFFAASILFLFITTVVVSAGWGKTCATFKNITSSGGVPRPKLNLSCTGPQYLSGSGPYMPNGADFITAAVFAGVGAVLAVGALCYFAKQMMQKDSETTPNKDKREHTE